ncbi:MAG: DUF624 domain-containing protein [Ruminococcaceae bacterium]|nr:DUF624 domain-containing protein [Oscillospiraceae bacterium]
MGKLFSLDNPFWRSLNTVADMLILNLLYVACCLPVITVGAATSALYAVSMKLASKDEDIYVTRSFFRAFVSNFKQATLIWLIFLGIGAFLLYDLYLVNVLYNLQWLEVVLLILCGYYLLCISYVFVLQSRYENTFGKTIRNSLLLAIANILPWSLLIGGINVLPLLVMWFQPGNMPVLIPVMLVGGYAASAYINSKIFNRVFARYHTKEEEV